MYNHTLGCLCIQKLSDIPDVIEQMRLRISSEKNESYSVALNHLLNEIHALCIKYEGANKKTYDANDVFDYGVNHRFGHSS